MQGEDHQPDWAYWLKKPIIDDMGIKGYPEHKYKQPLVKNPKNPKRQRKLASKNPEYIYEDDGRCKDPKEVRKIRPRYEF